LDFSCNDFAFIFSGKYCNGCISVNKILYFFMLLLSRSKHVCLTASDIYCITGIRKPIDYIFMFIVWSISKICSISETGCVHVLKCRGGAVLAGLLGASPVMTDVTSPSEPNWIAPDDGSRPSFQTAVHFKYTSDNGQSPP
jgi:hypothetical protein